jgi:ankyrin repeat protein
VKYLLSKGANINLNGKNRATPLILASAMNHFDVVEYLLETYQPPAKILAKDKFKRSALIMAVRNGNLKVASYLLRTGAEYNGADSSSNSAVHYAAAYGFPECIEVLVKAGAD